MPLPSTCHGYELSKPFQGLLPRIHSQDFAHAWGHVCVLCSVCCFFARSAVSVLRGGGEWRSFLLELLYCNVFRDAPAAVCYNTMTTQ